MASSRGRGGRHHHPGIVAIQRPAATTAGRNGAAASICGGQVVECPRGPGAVTMHSLTSGDLIAALRTHQLLQPGQITALGEVLAAEPADFLNDLVARGWLTPYQA